MHLNCAQKINSEQGIADMYRTFSIFSKVIKLQFTYSIFDEWN